MKKWTLKLSLLLLLLIISQVTFAQNSSVKGTVSDGKLAIEFVDVVLKNTTDSTKVAGYAVTDASGNFSLDHVTSGEYKIQFKLIGFKTVTQKVNFTGSPTSIGTITLKTDTNLKM